MPSVLNNGYDKKLGDAHGRPAVRWILEFTAFAFLIWLIFAIAGKLLPQIALKQLSELTNTKIEAKSIDFRYDGSVFINDLLVKPKQSAIYDNSILKAHTVRVHFRFRSLLTLSPKVSEIYVDDFTMRIQYNHDKGDWNFSGMKIQLPGGKFERIPLVWLEYGIIEYSKVIDNRIRVIASSPISAGFRPAEKIMGGYSFDISSSGRQNLSKSAIIGSWQKGKLVIAGRISSSDIPGFERQWTVKSLDAEMTREPNGFCQVMAKVKGFTSMHGESKNLFAFDTRTIADKAPFIDALQKFFKQYNPAGTIDIDLQAYGNPRHLNEAAIAGKVTCKEASICDSNFPYTIEHLTGEIEFTEKSAKLKNITAKHGKVGLIFDGWINDFGPDYKYRLEISSNNMLLDKELYNAINPREQRFWRDLSPTGIAATNYLRIRQGPANKKSTLTVQLIDVEGKYARFGYPLKNMTGKMVISDGNMIIDDVTSVWEKRKIIINGNINLRRAEKIIYDVTATAQDIPMDTILEEALPASQKEFYKQFESSGLFDMVIKVTNTETNDIFRAEVFPKNSFLKSKEFPLAISDVNGKLIFTPDIIDIEALSGCYKGGTVEISGKVWPRANLQKSDYCLSMRASKVNVSEDLSGVLPGAAGKLMQQLRPAGEVNISADFSTYGANGCNENQFVIECLNNSIDSNLLPYSLHSICGKIIFKNSAITINDIKAISTRIVRGSPFDSVLRLTGSMALSEANSPEKEIHVTGGDLNISGENIRFKKKSIAKMDSIISYDSDLGQWLSKYFTANFYDGKMIGKLQLAKSGKGGLDYLLETSVEGADLKKFLLDNDREQGPDEHYSTGSISGSLSMIGSLADDNIHLGRCRIKVNNMQVGKMSPLANLLFVLNLTEPSDYAFEQMTLDAYIQDNKMFLRQLDLSGKSVAFYGSGWLDLKTEEIKMSLMARGRRLGPANPSIWQSLTEGLTRAVVRVDIKGKLSEPEITTMPLPVIKETLEILGTPKN